MSFSFDTAYLIVGLVGFVIGLLFGIMAGGGARRRAAALAEKVRQLELDIDVREAERVRLQRELASATDQVRPLSDEVDRLRRERDQRKAATAAAIAAAPVVDTTTVHPVTPVATDLTGPAVAPTLAPPGPNGGDNLTLMKGVGDRFAAKLNEIGVTRFQQIADWSSEDEAAADARLGSFSGRLARDRVVEQARLLAAGRVTEYEARFGRLGE